MNQSNWRALLPPMLGAADGPDAGSARAYKLAAADPSVTRLAAACVFELTRLVEVAGYEHFLHAAVMGAATIDSTAVVWLENQLGMLRAEIDVAKKEAERATARRRAEVAGRRALVDAVNRVDAAASAERQSLLGRLDAARRDSPAAKSRWSELRAAGLTDAQIEGLNLPSEQLDPATLAAAYRERLAFLDAQLAKLRAFNEDPLHDPQRLRGVSAEIDVLVHAQLAASAAAN